MEALLPRMWLMAIGEQCQFQLVSPPPEVCVALKVLTLFSGWFLWQPVSPPSVNSIDINSGIVKGLMMNIKNASLFFSTEAVAEV